MPTYYAHESTHLAGSATSLGWWEGRRLNYCPGRAEGRGTWGVEPIAAGMAAHESGVHANRVVSQHLEPYQPEFPLVRIRERIVPSSPHAHAHMHLHLHIHGVGMRAGRRPSPRDGSPEPGSGRANGGFPLSGLGFAGCKLAGNLVYSVGRMSLLPLPGSESWGY